MRPTEPSTNIEYFSSLSSLEKLKHLVAFAALAPSSHNTQPWLFELDVPGSAVTLRANNQRALGYSDPTGRQMAISLGAALLNFIVAAEFFGYVIDVQYFPQGQLGDAVARVSMGMPDIPGQLSEIGASASGQGLKGANLEHLIAAMLTRHNNRFPYEDRQFDGQFASILQNFGADGVHIDFIADPGRKALIAELVGEALRHAMDDAEFRYELSQWIKSSHPKHQDGMPGYNLGMPAAMALVFPAMLRTFRLGKVQKMLELKSLLRTPAFIVLSTVEDTKKDWLATGMVFERIALEAERLGLRTGVLAAPIEVPGFSGQLQQILQTAQQPQMFFRVGYCGTVPKSSPRLSLDKIIN